MATWAPASAPLGPHQCTRSGELGAARGGQQHQHQPQHCQHHARGPSTSSTSASCTGSSIAAAPGQQRSGGTSSSSGWCGNSGPAPAALATAVHMAHMPRLHMAHMPPLHMAHGPPQMACPLHCLGPPRPAPLHSTVVTQASTRQTHAAHAHHLSTHPVAYHAHGGWVPAGHSHAAGARSGCWPAPGGHGWLSPGGP